MRGLDEDKEVRGETGSSARLSHQSRARLLVIGSRGRKYGPRGGRWSRGERKFGGAKVAVMVGCIRV